MDILVSILTSIITSGIVVWFARKLIGEWLTQRIRLEYEQKLETFKAQLKGEADCVLERLRADLQVAASRRNIAYSHIHEKRLDVISQLAGKLYAFHQAVAAYVSAIESAEPPSKEDMRKNVAKRLSDFNDYFGPGRLFLPQATVEKIESFKKGLLRISMNFMLRVESAQDTLGTSKPDLDAWMQASKYADEKAPKLIRELENDFRQILGILGIDSSREESLEAQRQVKDLHAGG